LAGEVKNRDERLMILNTVAKSIIENQRGQHKQYAFPFGKPDGDGDETMVHRMNDSIWKKARVRAANSGRRKTFAPLTPAICLSGFTI